MPAIHNCWHCDASLLKNKFNKDWPFHCNEKCRDACALWNRKPSKVRWEKEDLEPKPKKEEEPSKPKRTITCKNCGGVGHNTRTCKKEKKENNEPDRNVRDRDRRSSAPRKRTVLQERLAKAKKKLGLK